MYVPAKRRLAMDDPFFDLGNAETNIYFHIKKHPSPITIATTTTNSKNSDSDNSSSGNTSNDNSGQQAITQINKVLETNIDTQYFSFSTRTIICHEPPCQGTAHPAMSYELHYDQMHRNNCSTCNAIFPSSHWLDLHIQEYHDMFFQARIARTDGGLNYSCFLPACVEMFESAGERKEHMIDVHRFPLSFTWDLVQDGLRHAGRDDDDDDDGNDGDDECAEDMDVDLITAGFKQSLRISAPEKITFGRHEDNQYQYDHWK
ncbi:hypothetical protein LPJ66_001157 [Kickxella alabastrina]|uniref:Uncharacterized protein n=1 Tax=Kickxella alabastrina TaxID=61397 RepID=A0ACC1IU18_9FUNG|nr:hypothetical protein LPJ66_001157 [Kickxella alabastrina]